jgi:hypothetical protein
MTSSPTKIWRLTHPLSVGGLSSGPACRAETRYHSKLPSLASSSPEPCIVETLCSSGKGRWRGRDRWPHRVSRIDLLDRAVRIGTLNTQGLNPTLIAHQLKLAALITESRTRKWDVLQLSDLHFSSLDFPSDPANARPLFLLVEEFLLIQWYHVGFLLSTPAKQRWLHEGRPFITNGDRLLAINLPLFGSECWWVSMYIPPTGERALRQFFFREATQMVIDLRGKEQWWSGDTNSHVGRDKAEGGFGLLQATTAHVTDFREWLLDNQELMCIDHSMKCKQRGTWQHPTQLGWYELDLFLGPRRSRKCAQTLSTAPFVYSDHRSKTLIIHGRNPMKSAKHHHSCYQLELQKPLMLAKLRGPGVLATARRADLERRMDDHLGAYRRDQQLDMDSTPTIPWPALACTIVKEVEDIVGRGPRLQLAVPYTEENLVEIREQEKAIISLLRQAHDGDSSLEVRLSARAGVRSARRTLSTYRDKARALWGRQLASRLRKDLALGDFQAFHAGLKFAGIHAFGRQKHEKLPFSLDEITKYNAAIGAETFAITPEVLAELPEQQNMAWHLGNSPCQAEVLRSMRKMKDSAGGKDEMTMGMLRAAGAGVLCATAEAVVRLWALPGEEWPPALHDVLGVLLFKKGDPHKLQNYRTIMLICLVSRIIARVASDRIYKYVEQQGILSNFQWGFRTARSTLGPIFVLKVLSEILCLRPNVSFENAFGLLLVDIRKAYPRVPRELAWQLFGRIGLPPKLLQVLQALHDHPSYQVKSPEGLGEFYKMLRGFREGCPSSPVCFNIFHTFPIKVFRGLVWSDEVPVFTSQVGRNLASATRHGPPRDRPGKDDGPAAAETLTFQLLELLFADDTSVFQKLTKFRDTEATLQQVLARWGEDLHSGKTERLPLGVTPETAARHTGEVWQDAVRFLGAWLANDSSCSRDSKERLKAAKRVWNKLCRQTGRLNLPCRTLGLLFTAAVEGSLLYACEVRTYSAKEIQEYQVFLNGCTLRLTNQRRRDMHEQHVTMVDCRKKLGTLPVATSIGFRRLAWLQRLAKMPFSRPERMALFLWAPAELRATTSQRQPHIRTQYAKLLEELRTQTDLDAHTWQKTWVDIACDSKRWNALTKSWKKTKMAKDTDDTWENRHAPGGTASLALSRATERKILLHGLVLNADGTAPCIFCGENFNVKHILQHQTSCRRLPEPRRAAAKANRARRLALAATHTLGTVAAPCVPVVVPPVVDDLRSGDDPPWRTTNTLGTVAAPCVPVVVPPVVGDLRSGDTPPWRTTSALALVPRRRLYGKHKDPDHLVTMVFYPERHAGLLPPPRTRIRVKSVDPNFIGPRHPGCDTLVRPRNRLVRPRSAPPSLMVTRRPAASSSANDARALAKREEFRDFPERFFPSGQRRTASKSGRSSQRGRSVQPMSERLRKGKVLSTMQLPVWWDRVIKWRDADNMKCDFCKRAYVDRHKLIRHTKVCVDMPYDIWIQGIRLVHSETTDYSCQHCGTAGFVTSLGRARHAHECAKRRILHNLPLDSRAFHIVPPPARVV